MSEQMLKACPFCGGPVYKCGTKPDDIHSCHHITCDKCGQFDLYKAVDPNNDLDDLDEANRRIVEFWNRRAAPISADKEKV